ncbi:MULTISPECIES: ferrous iron transport protein B [unclassified Acinetobacter]|uniref:ferrous iron transport protein B n=1 Tax=unclassified Acinetobacter TaxID=196816 RepID=UPI0035BB7748
MENQELRLALVGNPNCGKTSLFNQLTGTKQKVANYAGVTVERKEGYFRLDNGQTVRILDLPGAYSLNAVSPDEEVTRDVCLGVRDDAQLDALLCILDASNLRLHLNLLLEVLRLQRPVLVVLNMMDEARQQGVAIDIAKLSSLLGVPVVEAVAVKKQGLQHLLTALGKHQFSTANINKIQDLDVRDIYPQVVTTPASNDMMTSRLDDLFLHSVFGLISLAVIMFLIFQAVFYWSAPFMDGIESLFGMIGEWVEPFISDPILKSLVIDGIIAGAGGVVVFLPQILFLFLFIFLLEDSGYLPRAAFLLDKLMSGAGLSGRSFIPLLSSFACAVPGIMATRSITDPRERLVTIFVAPLMTCSARLPVYALLIAAFIPNQTVWGFFNLQGLVLFALYFAGIISALIVAFIVKLFKRDKSEHSLLLELPRYRIPRLKNVALGVYERAKIFMKRVGGIIFALTIILWFLSSFPEPPADATMPAIQYSMAGQLGQLLQPIFAPLGFPWQLCIALIPAMAAREVVVAALGTVYAVSGEGDSQADGLATLLSSPDSGWSLATAFALLVWFIYAPHCLATLATVKRETGSWGMVMLMTTYLFGLAYLAAFITYQIAIRW